MQSNPNKVSAASQTLPPVRIYLPDHACSICNGRGGTHRGLCTRCNKTGIEPRNAA